MISSLIASLAIHTVFAAAAPVPSPETDYSLEEVSGSFSSPLYVTAPEGDDRLFVVERGGDVELVIGDTRVGTYATVSQLITPSPGGEQGLLGMAFHPDFASNGVFFLSYTDAEGDLVVRRYSVDPQDNAVGTPPSTAVIRIPQFAANHNGGMILFGPDDLLYVGSGDGGGSGDPQGNGQNTSTLLGAILRIDPDQDDFPADPAMNYGIPEDNPFVGAAGLDEILIYGLRNPWRFWIDRPTNRLYIADVGQNAREEVTVLAPTETGVNLGWNRLEGSRCYSPPSGCSSAGTVLPDVEYAHTGGGASITGGVVYRGSQLPGLQGTYFYADFIAGWVRSFRFNGTVSQHYDWSNRFDTSLVSSFGVDGHGEMYIVSLGGTVWRLVGPEAADEVFFYRNDGSFRYYDISPNGSLGAPILSGTGYSSTWKVITSVDLEGDDQDEMMFYKASGQFAYYNVRANGTIGAPILSGPGYSHKWDSISNVDLDGDGQDEMFFYDATLGLFSYYDIRPNATLSAKLNNGNYSLGWNTITSVDLDGDGVDEMLFYRQNGSFRYYEMHPDGRFATLLASGTGYSQGWSSITSVDMDGDGQDELLFYRTDGTYKYYSTSSRGLRSLIASGTGYSPNWNVITSVDLD
jgi:glucose/arabinose dehydrogenase